jgi:hypothetical protein
MKRLALQRMNVFFLCAVLMTGLLFILPAFAQIQPEKKKSTTTHSTTGKKSAQPKAKATPQIDPKAQEILRAACDYLAKANSFSVTADVKDLRAHAEGERPTTRTVELKIRRPDRMAAHIVTGKADRLLMYDGTTLTLFNKTRNFYGEAGTSGTLDNVIDRVEERLGFSFPLADIVVSNPYESAMKNVKGGCIAGQEEILGAKTNHLTFTQNSIDWDIWIEEGAKPLIRQIVIEYKKEPGTPEYRATLRDWDTEHALPDQAFVFEKTKDAKRIKIEGISPNQGDSGK